MFGSVGLRIGVLVLSNNIGSYSACQLWLGRAIGPYLQQTVFRAPYLRETKFRVFCSFLFGAFSAE